ncbi:MAG: hypothetical protein Q9162_001023 [Coniocarpon cinnabarinum]
MATYLITGCSQGLGLAIVEHLATLPSSAVSLIIATSRSPAPNEALQSAIKKCSGRAQHLELDIESDASVNAAAEKTKTILGDRGLDVLLNNAGLMANTISPFMGDATLAMLTSCFDVNVLGTHRMINALLPLCRRSVTKKIINVTSTQGSMTLAFQPPHLWAHAPDYKVSKAALNMLSVQWGKSLAEEGFCVLSVSPGWLQTELGTFRGQMKVTPDLTAAQGAQATVDIIEKATKADNATFRNIKIEGSERYRGEIVGW